MLYFFSVSEWNLAFLLHEVFGNTQSYSRPLLMFLICLIYQTYLKKTDCSTLWQLLYVHIPVRHPSSYPELEVPTLLQVSFFHNIYMFTSEWTFLPHAQSGGGWGHIWLGGCRRENWCLLIQHQKEFKFPKLWLQNTMFYLLKKLILILIAFRVWILSINWHVTCFIILMCKNWKDSVSCDRWHGYLSITESIVLVN